MKPVIGFIGLGIMGRPMARNLIRSGYQLYVFNSSEKAIAELQQAGAMRTASPKEVAQKTDIIISILPDTPQVKAVALGQNGLIEGLSAGKLFIDMSTIDAAAGMEIQERFAAIGVDTLDAPVSGGQAGAEAATLSIMVGGKREAFERALPVFQVLGKKISHMGDSGAGQITKSCNQIATALATQGVIEAFTLARSAGIDIAKLREAMLGGFAESRVLSIAGEKMVRRDFAPGFKVGLYRKDLRIAQNAATERSLSLPGMELMAGEMEALLSAGKADLDFSALIQLFEK